LLDYLQDSDNTDPFSVYQPVSALFVNSSLYDASDAQTFNNDDFLASNGALVSPTSSYTFSETILKQLSSYGCDLKSFIGIYASSFDYVNGNNKAATLVEWSEDGNTNPDVYRW
jgi:hypothetical protein